MATTRRRKRLAILAVTDEQPFTFERSTNPIGSHWPSSSFSKASCWRLRGKLRRRRHTLWVPYHCGDLLGDITSAQATWSNHRPRFRAAESASVVFGKYSGLRQLPCPS